VLPTINEHEHADTAGYDGQPEATGTSLPSEERSHARLLQEISGYSSAGLAGGAVARLEGRRHRAASGGNALRAAVLGANDGLLPNFSLVMGVAGAEAPAIPKPSAAPSRMNLSREILSFLSFKMLLS
jgi:hypothetical protein